MRSKYWLERRLLLLLSMSDDGGASGTGVDFGSFFESAADTAKNESEADGDAEAVGDAADGDDADLGGDADEPVDDDDRDTGDGLDDDEAEDATESDATDLDPATVSMSAIAQQQKILEGLLRQQKEAAPLDVPATTEVADIDPFESEEFTKMTEVMNWDSEEQEAAKNFFQKFMAYGNNKSLAEWQRQTPRMVENTIQQNERIKGARESFYAANPMLEEVKPFVGQIAQGVAQELGEAATMEAVLKEAARRAYKALGVDPKKVGAMIDKQQRQDKRKPAFPVKKGARKQITQLPKIQQEIDAVIGL